MGECNTDSPGDSTPSDDSSTPEALQARALVLRALENAKENSRNKSDAKKSISSRMHGRKPQSNTLQVTSEAEELTASAVAVRLANAKVTHREETIKLRKMVAIAAICFVSVQIIASNVFFGWYIFHAKTAIKPEIMIAWLSASVVEIIGIMGIVALSLFPNKNGQKQPKASAPIKTDAS